MSTGPFMGFTVGRFPADLELEKRQKNRIENRDFRLRGRDASAEDWQDLYDEGKVVQDSYKSDYKDRAAKKLMEAKFPREIADHIGKYVGAGNKRVFQTLVL